MHWTMMLRSSTLAFGSAYRGVGYIRLMRLNQRLLVLLQ
jgi:hypothetical protein